MLTWLFLAACLALSFLLSGMEAGVFALNRLRVRQLARAGQPSAKLLHGFLENPENFLWTILVGNTLANFVILGWVVAKLHDRFPGRYALDHRPFRRDRVFVLRAVRSAAENAVSRASQPVVPLGGPAFPARPLCPAPAGGAGGNHGGRLCCAGPAGTRSPAACSATARKCARSCRNPRRRSRPTNAP